MLTHEGDSQEPPDMSHSGKQEVRHGSGGSAPTGFHGGTASGFGEGISERRTCVVLRFCRRSLRYKSVRGDQAPLRQRIRDIAEARVRYGFRRIHILLLEGWMVNHRRVRRLYREEGLNLRHMRPRRHVTAARRMEHPEITAANQVWAMNFVSDALFNGKRFRSLTVVDTFTRECLAIEVGQGLKGDNVAAVMERIKFLRGAVPAKIRADNGPEFISRVLDHWAYVNGGVMDFSRPTMPISKASTVDSAMNA